MNTQLNPIVKSIGNKAAFAEAVTAAVSAYNNAANAIASLAVLSIETYHINSFNNEYITIVFNALQNNPKLLKGFKLMLTDMTLLNDDCQPKKLKGNSRAKAKKAIASRKESFIEQVNSEGFTLTKYVACKAFDDKKAATDKSDSKANNTDKSTNDKSDSKPNPSQQIKAIQDELNALNTQAIEKAQELNRLQKDAGMPQSESTLQELARITAAYAGMAKTADNLQTTLDSNVKTINTLKNKVTAADNKALVEAEKTALLQAIIANMVGVANKAKTTKLGKAIIALAS
jgi:hypothetical protein